MNIEYSYPQPNSLPTMAPSLIFFDLNMFNNYHFHNQTRYQHWLQTSILDWILNIEYWIFMSTTKLNTNIGYRPCLWNRNILNIHIHNQTRYQPWLHLPFSSILTHSTYSYLQPNSLPTSAPDTHSWLSPKYWILNIYIHNQTRYQPWLHLQNLKSKHVP